MSKKDALNTVLDEFLKITRIPRPSHHEEKIGRYLMDWAAEHGLKAEMDAMGSVIIDKPASPGCEAVPRTILQSHMDMVCVAAEGVSFDPLSDPIKVIYDGETIRADGTSLGADDGIGIALSLYLLSDDSLRHGPLRAVITTNEEDGMDSVALEPKYLEGKYLINLDWETIGSLCNSCAGGDFFNYRRAANWGTVPADSVGFELSFRGLLGGHSGVGINKGHANAIVSAATALQMLSKAGIGFRIGSFSGGQAKNAIPAQAQVTIALDASNADAANAVLAGFEREFRDCYGNIEPDMELRFGPVTTPERVLSEQTSRALAGLMCAVPNNVHTMSPFVDGLVESSSNLGVVELGDSDIRFTVFARSSVAYPATQLGLICAALGEAFGFEFESEGHVPGWAVNPNSKLTPLACEVYERLTGEKMIVESVHAGVECGAFAEKNPKLDMIAIGPTLLDVHTPNETCKVADVKLTAELLVDIIEELASCSD